MGGLEDFEVRLFKGGDLGWFDGIQMSSDAGVDDGDLIGGGHGHVLSLSKGGRNDNVYEEISRSFLQTDASPS